MKLLLDENLSPRLVDELSDSFHAIAHVRLVGLATATDEHVWDFARTNGFTIVSKDSDFIYRALLYGPPPKIISIQLGNCATRDVAALLRARLGDLDQFQADPDAALLVLP